MPHIFLSHASSDQEITSAIADALSGYGVSTWASFRNIVPGAHWDESIEKALKESHALIVIVSPASVKSRYVRAEVDDAIRNQKTVIPVIAESTELPLRWKTLQHIRWDAAAAVGCAARIASALPGIATIDFQEALRDSARFDDVRTLLLQHTEWLPLEFAMAPDYVFKTNAFITPKSQVDCFAGRLDTPGPRAFLYYLGSPYHSPITQSGAPSLYLRGILGKVRNHLGVLAAPLPETHPLAPNAIFKDELHHWRVVLPNYTVMRVLIIAGRRSHFEGQAGSYRQKVAAHATEVFFHEAGRHGSLDIVSYDRILDGIVPNPSINKFF